MDSFVSREWRLIVPHSYHVFRIANNATAKSGFDTEFQDAKGNGAGTLTRTADLHDVNVAL